MHSHDMGSGGNGRDRGSIRRRRRFLVKSPGYVAERLPDSLERARIFHGSLPRYDAGKHHSASNTSYFWVEGTFGVVKTEFFRISFLLALAVVAAVFSLLVLRQKQKVLASGT
jgi:hypothetical protein